MAVQNISLTSPYTTEQEEIKRRRKIYEALQAKSLEDTPTQVIGGWAVPNSPLQGIGKIAQALAAAYGTKKADEEEKALGERYSKDFAREISEALAIGRGTPEVPERWTGEAGTPDEMYRPAEAAVPGDPDKMYDRMAMSKFPQLQTAGLANIGKKKDSPFAKVDPKDYTPQSIAEFAKTGNASVLVPVRKMEALSNVAGPSGPQTQFYNPYAPPTEPIRQAVRNEMVNTGGSVQPVNPYTQSAPIQNTVSPNTVYTQGQENLRHGTPSGSAQLSAATTRRGQDLTDSRTREANTIAAQTALLKQQELENKLRQQGIANAGTVAAYQIAVDTLGRLENHPGIGEAVGIGLEKTVAPFVGPIIPGTPRADFVAELDAFKSQTFLPMVQQLRGMGALSDAEGKKLTDAVGALTTAMSEGAFKSSIARIRADLSAAAARMGGQVAPSAIPQRRTTDRQRRASDQPAVIDFNALPPGR